MFHDRMLLEALGAAIDPDGKPGTAERLRGLIDDAINPLGRKGSRLTSEKAAELGRRLLGGAGAVMRSGECAPLGPTRTHQSALIHLTTACIVRLELWLPFATMACGSWHVRGPGSSTIDLVPNEPLVSPGLVVPEDFGVLVARGLEGEFPTWITFGP